MIRFFIGFLTFFNAFFRSRYSLGPEILALRQQPGVLKRKRPRTRLRTQDRMFWVPLGRPWPAWSNILVIVKPETVVGWHRTGFRLFWRLTPRDQARKLWAAFLRNHRDVIVAMDFFTVPTLTFRILYCFFVIEHGRCRIVHFNVTEHPTGPLDRTATEGVISGILSLPLCDSGS
ncbi:MAG: hypothetical protein HXY20_13625 [Acidobacteria bacterium]|nr:hypothetical protein [Acidobacteriota bacterium]